MPTSADRIEMILEQVDALPTLGAIAVRVVQLTSRDDSDSGELIRVISSDPSLAARVLKLSRCIDRVRADKMTTVERAVLHLGFDAVRSVALSVGVFNQFDRFAIEPEERRSDPAVFDRRAFWRHSLAVASLCEQLARTPGLNGRVNAGEAFLAGLLHDLGLLALHTLLPRSVDRMCKLAETSGISLDEACSRVVGITQHTAARRLGERWKLPQPLVDVMWLNGQRFDMLPEMPHIDLVKLVSLADAVARGRYITPIGHTFRGEPVPAMALDLGIDEEQIERFVNNLSSDIAQRAEALGLDLEPDAELLLDSITRANDALGRLNAALRKRAEQAEVRERILRSIMAFHESEGSQDTVADVFNLIVASAAPVLGRPPVAAVFRAQPLDTWRLIRFARARGEEPARAIPVEDLALELGASGAPVPARLATAIGGGKEQRSALRVLPVPCRGDVQAALIHEDNSATETSDLAMQVDALNIVWAGAVAAAIQREQANRLSEALVNANRLVGEAQDELARQRAHRAIGEIVAGAAHEMNNPLTVISGRSQQILVRESDPALRTMAEEIVKESHRLSDLLTTLRRLTEPAEPQRKLVDVARLVTTVAQEFRPQGKQEHQIDAIIADSIPPAFLDPEQVSLALTELIRNAIESKGSRHIEVRVQTEGANDRLKVQVRDDGAGLNLHALTHAFEPFFSSKGAGRQPGLGLAHAKRYVEAHGGRITLENGPNGGAVATIWLDDCFVTEHERRSAA